MKTRNGLFAKLLNGRSHQRRQDAHAETQEEALDRLGQEPPFLPTHWRNLVTLLLDDAEMSNGALSEELRMCVAQMLPARLMPTETWRPQDRFYLAAAYLIATASPDALRAFLRGQKVILGLRVETSSKANSGLGRYDDRFVVVKRNWPAYAGEAYEFMGNTEPAYKYDALNPNKSKTMGQDVDGDGVADLGRIPTGTHQFKKGFTAKRGNILIPTVPIQLERDSNHDGWFGNDVVKAKLAANLDAGDTFFHKGGRGGFTGSAGCQTLEAGVFDKFWAALESQQEFYYVIVNVS